MSRICNVIQRDIPPCGEGYRDRTRWICPSSSYNLQCPSGDALGLGLTYAVAQGQSSGNRSCYLHADQHLRAAGKGERALVADSRVEVNVVRRITHKGILPGPLSISESNASKDSVEQTIRTARRSWIVEGDRGLFWRCSRDSKRRSAARCNNPLSSYEIAKTLLPDS